jgi:phosphoenolpyruvate carboxykinase (GTP)
MCGKTSTAMLPGERIVGDDIAYLRSVEGRARAANVECGIFGIIGNVNAQDDPVIYQVLTRPGEVIFSNVLVAGGRPYWIGMGEELPPEGHNFSGPWRRGKTDAEGRDIPPSHPNARYTVSIKALDNCDPRLDDPDGVPVAGIMYGGRDSDTSVPVQESFGWAHGVITMGASIESETTAATLGAAGVRKFNMMSNQDFLAIPFGKYIRNHLDFGAAPAEPPAVFATNYWLKNERGEWLNGKLDKHVWVKWMERRVHGEVEAVESPTGLIPKYEDLRTIFEDVLEKSYSRDHYVEQFTIRVRKNLEKLDRVEKILREFEGMPEVVFEALAAQRERLETLREAKGDAVSPFDL